MPSLPALRSPQMLPFLLLASLVFLAVSSRAQSVPVGYHIVAGEDISTIIQATDSGGTLLHNGSVGAGDIAKGTLTLPAGGVHTLSIESGNTFTTNYYPDYLNYSTDDTKSEAYHVEEGFIVGQAVEEIEKNYNVSLSSEDRYGSKTVSEDKAWTRSLGSVTNVGGSGVDLSLTNLYTDVSADFAINAYADYIRLSVSVGTESASHELKTPAKRTMVDEAGEEDSTFSSDGEAYDSSEDFTRISQVSDVVDFDFVLFSSPAAKKQQPLMVFRTLGNRNDGNIYLKVRELEDEDGSDVNPTGSFPGTIDQDTEEGTYQVVSYDSDVKGIGFFDTDYDSNGSATKGFMGQGQSDLVTIGNPNIWVSDIWNGNHSDQYGSEEAEFLFGTASNNAPGPAYDEYNWNDEIKLGFTPDFVGYWAIAHRAKTNKKRLRWILHGKNSGCLGSAVQEVVFGAEQTDFPCDYGNDINDICDDSEVGISPSEAIKESGTDKYLATSHDEFKFPCPQWAEEGQGTVDVTATSTYNYDFSSSKSVEIEVSPLDPDDEVGGEKGWYLESVELDVLQIHTDSIVAGSGSESSELSASDWETGLSVELSSPDGMTEILDLGVSGVSTQTTANTMLTQAFQGESISGTWSLKVEPSSDRLFLVKDIQLNWVRHDEGECSIQPTNSARLFPVGFSEDVEDAYVEDCGNAGEEVLLAHSSSATASSLSVDVPSPAAGWDEVEVQQLSSDVVALSDPRADEALLAFRLSVFDAAQSDPLKRNNGLSLSDGANGESSCDGLVLAHSFLAVDACTDAAKLRRTNVYVPHRGGGGLWDVWLSDSFMSSLGLAPDGAKVLFLDDDDFSSGAVANLWSTGDLNLTTENQSSAWLVLPAAPELHELYSGTVGNVHSNVEQENDLLGNAEGSLSWGSGSASHTLDWSIGGISWSHVHDVIRGGSSWDASTAFGHDGASVSVQANVPTSELTIAYTTDAYQDPVEEVLRVGIPLHSSGCNDAYVNSYEAAVNNCAYWGIPNGADYHGVLSVQVTNEYGNQFDYTLASDAEPLVVRNLPYLNLDRIEWDIPVADLLSAGFTAGDVVELSVAGFWSTHGRRVLLHADQAETLTLCNAEPTGVTLTADNANPSVDDDVVLSWGVNNGGTTEIQWLTPEADDWVALASYRDNTARAYTVTGLDAYDCQTLEFRVVQDICGVQAVSPVVSISVQDETASPWVGHSGEHLSADKGYSSETVKVSWNNDGLTDDFTHTLQRRLYLPGSDDASAWNDITTFTASSDQHADAAVGANVMYEYRINSVRECASGTSVYTTAYPSDPAVGFRRGVGSVSGNITYGSGSGVAVEGVTVSATRTEGASLRRAMTLDTDHLLQVDMTGLGDNEPLPSLLNSADSMAVSFWWKVNAMDDQGLSPVLTLLDTLTEDSPHYQQLYSLKARETGDGTFELIQLEGTKLDLVSDTEFAQDTWYHLALFRTDVGLEYHLNGDSIAVLNTALNPTDASALLLGGALDLVEACIDPDADESNSFADVIDQTACSYPAGAGCQDPTASNYASVAGDLTLAPCTYDEARFGTTLILEWFTDDAPEDYFPRITDDQGVTVHDFQADIEFLDPDEFAITALTTLLPTGDYELGVWDDTQNDWLQSDDWAGAFKLSASDGTVLFAWSNYDWTAASHGDATNTDFASSYFRFATGSNACTEAVDNSTVTTGALISDCVSLADDATGDCWSGTFDGASSTSWSNNTIDASEWTVSTWFRLDDLPATSAVVWQLGADLQLSVDSDRHLAWNGVAMDDVVMMQDLWYHVVVRNASAGLSVDVSHTATDLEGTDGEPDNDPVTWSSSASSVDTANEVHLGGDAAGQKNLQGAIEYLFAWNRALSDEEVVLLRNGVTADDYDGDASSVVNNGGLSSELSVAIGAAHSGFVDRLSGSSLDKGGIVMERRGHGATCNAGCLHESMACNYNPLANAWASCISCDPDIISGSTSFQSGALSLDEVQIWSNVNDGATETTALELALANRFGYPSYSAAGLTAYWECDEGWGTGLYDRVMKIDDAEAAADFHKVDGAFFSLDDDGQMQDASEANSYGFFSEDIPTSLELAAVTDTSGVYVIENIKYEGGGDLFTFTPSYGVHVFDPSSRSSLLGDDLSTVNNIDFVDQSFFDYQVTVEYRAQSDGHVYGADRADVAEAGCGVAGVWFLIDGVYATTEDGLVETDENGNCTLQVPVGLHTVEAYKADHTFAQDAFSVDVTGEGSLSFVDNTTRSVVGRLLGGAVEAAKDWDASYGNLGTGSLYLTPVDAVVTTDPLSGCPPAHVTTDSTGQYAVELLPLQYNLLSPSDWDGYEGADGLSASDMVVLDDYLGDEVEDNDLVGFWLDKLDITEGGWDVASATTAAYDVAPGWDNTAYGGSAGCTSCAPDSAFLRVDLMYTIEVEGNAYQSQMSGEDCSATPLLTDDYGNAIYAFIGDAVHGYSVGASTTEVNLAEAYEDFYEDFKGYDFSAAYSKQKPFPFGHPVITGGHEYCLTVEQQEVYVSVDSTARYSLTVAESDVNVISIGNMGATVTSTATDEAGDEKLVYRLLVGSPEYNEYAQSDNDMPTAGIQVQIEGVLWNPHQEAFDLFDHYASDYSDGAYTTLTGADAAKDLGVWGTLDADQFVAMHVGAAFDDAELPISTGPVLDFIIRDPPGDASSTTLEEGSVVNNSTTYENSHSFGGENSLTYFAGADIDVQNCGGVGIVICTEALDVNNDNDLTVATEYSYEDAIANTYSQELSFEQSISTSGDDDYGDLGYNQDVFYGTTQNVMAQKLGVFSFWDASSSNFFAALDAALMEEGSTQEPVWESPNLVAFDGNSFAIDDSIEVSPVWANSAAVNSTVDSYFMKTQYGIEAIELNYHKDARDDVFAAGITSGDYTLGSYWTNADWQSDCDCSETSEHPMYGTNNDDPRWAWYYGQNPSTGNFRGYVEADTTGPSYTYFQYDADGEDLVWEANMALLDWQLILAENELEKLNARFDLSVDEFTTPDLADVVLSSMDNIQSGNLDAMASETLYDYIEEDEPDISADLWSQADWSPFALSFSGGGAAFSQTLGVSAVSEVSRAGSVSNSVNFEAVFQFTFFDVGLGTENSIGFEYVRSREQSSEQETSMSYSYEIADDDPDDFYLTYVAPGEGMSSPIFLLLGGASSCPRINAEEAKFAEFYRMLSPDSDYSTNDDRTTGSYTMERDDDGDCIATKKEFTVVADEGGTDDDNNDYDEGDVLFRSVYEDERDTWWDNKVIAKEKYDASDDDADGYEVSKDTLVQTIAGFRISEKLCDALEGETTSFEIQPALAPVDSVDLSIDQVGQNELFLNDSPMDEALVVNLLLENESPINATNDYIVYVDATTNELGSSIQFSDGGAVAGLALVPSSESAGALELNATIISNGVYTGETDQIVFVAESECDNAVVDVVTLNYDFAPACSELSLLTPVEGWYTYEDDGDPYTASSSSLTGTTGLALEVEVASPHLRNYLDEAVVVQYKLEGDLDWTDLYTWDASSVGSALDDSDNLWALDVDGLDLISSGLESQVQLRAVGQCTQGLTSYSEVVTGTVDRVAPDLFGRPLPLDQVLEEDDEIRFRFTEAMDVTSFGEGNVEILGQLNTDPTIHSGGLGFGTGEALTLLDAPSLFGRDWVLSMQFYVEDVTTIGSTLSGELFSQTASGEALSAKLSPDGSGGAPALTIEGAATSSTVILDGGDTTLSAVPPFVTGWNTFVFQGSRGGDGTTTVTFTLNGQSGTDIDASHSAPGFDFPEVAGGADLIFGNNAAGDYPFSQVLHEVRLWNPQNEPVAGFETVSGVDNYTYESLVGTEVGLAAWLPLDELQGVPVEQSRSRTVLNSAHWAVPEADFKALSLDGTERVLMKGGAGETYFDATLSCWFRKTASGAAVLMGVNGPLSSDQGETFNSENWELGIDGSQRPYVVNSGDTMTSSSAASEGWHHLALVRERYGTTRLLLDAQEVASASTEAFGILNPYTVILGGAYDSSASSVFISTQGFTGEIDEVRLWTAAREADAIASQMHSDVSGQAALGWLADFEQTGTHSSGSEVFLFTNAMASDPDIALESFTSGSAASVLETSSVLVQSTDVALIQSESTVEELLSSDVFEVSWNADHDELIVDLEEDLYYELEGQELVFTLYGGDGGQLEDLLGNDADDIQWTMTVDLFPLAWGAPSVSAEALLGEALTWSVDLLNNGSSNEAFEIVDGPSWIEVSPSSGTLTPNSSQTITFTVSEAQFIDEGSVDVRVTGDFCDDSGNEDDWCYGERLTLDYKVSAEVPDVSFDPTPYNSVMSVTAKLYLKEHASYDDEDILYAYVGDELRGMAHCDNWISGQAIAFLSVFYDAADATTGAASELGQKVDFRVWDASRGVMVSALAAHWPTLEDDIDVTLAEAGWGNVFEPLILQMGDVVETTVDLTAGWNWISLPFDHPDHTDDEGWTEWSVGDVLGDMATDVEVVKSTGQAWVSTYDAASGQWAGSASTPMALNHTYQVKLSADASVVWTGRMPDDVDSTAFEVVTGWNDLGFPSQRELSVEEALRSLYDAGVLELNDEVKGRYDGFATYLGNGEWAGTLDRLEPTRGYRLYLAGDGTTSSGDSLGILVLPESSLFLGSPTLRADQAIGELPEALAASVRGLQHSMEVIAELAMPSHWVRSPKDRIEWWSQGRLMASARPHVLDAGERYFVQGYGQEAVGDVEVRYVSGVHGLSYVSDDRVRFEPNGRLGSYSEPVVWRFSEEGAEPVLSELAIVPNPFRSGFEVVYSGEEVLQTLSLIDPRGRTIEVRRGSEGVQRYPWQTESLPSGMYFVRIETASGAVHRIPVVKQ